MNKRIIFRTEKDIIIFKNSQSNFDFWGINKKQLDAKIKITEEYGGNEKDVPSNKTIRAFPIRFSKSIDLFNDEYILIEDEATDFPINQIEWVFIQIIEDDQKTKIEAEIEEILKSRKE